jgi:hypothetical protein
VSADQRPLLPTQQDSAFGHAAGVGHAAPFSLLVTFTDEQMEEIARRAALLVAVPEASSWLDTRGAADHIAATPARVHDLVALGKLTPRRDGRRLLFRREDLDVYVEGSA